MVCLTIFFVAASDFGFFLVEMSRSSVKISPRVTVTVKITAKTMYERAPILVSESLVYEVYQGFFVYESLEVLAEYVCQTLHVIGC